MNTTATTTARAGTGDRLLTRSFVLLTAAELAYFTADGIAIYTLPLFVTGPVGSDMAGAGIAFGAFAVSALLLRPFAGRFSDTWGRRPLLITGALLSAVSMMLTAHAGTLAAVVTLRLVLGVAEAAFLVAAIAALADLAPPGRLGEAMSVNSLGLYLGLAMGPPLGEALVRTAGFAVAWYGAAAASMIAAAVVLCLGETRSPQTDRSAPAPLIHRATVPLAAGFCTSVVAAGGFLAFTALHADAVGLPNPSIPLFAYGIMVVICRVLFAKVPDRVPALPLGASALANHRGRPDHHGGVGHARRGGRRRGGARRWRGVQHSGLLHGDLHRYQTIGAGRRLRYGQRVPGPGNRRWPDPARVRRTVRRNPLGIRCGSRGRPRLHRGWRRLFRVSASTGGAD